MKHNVKQILIVSIILLTTFSCKKEQPDTCTEPLYTNEPSIGYSEDYRYPLINNIAIDEKRNKGVIMTTAVNGEVSLHTFYYTSDGNLEFLQTAKNILPSGSFRFLDFKYDSLIYISRI